jgi:hypothetical protein
MSGTSSGNYDHQDPILVDGYTFIYNRILSALLDDGVLDDAIRTQFAKRITDAVWELHLSVNSRPKIEQYNNYSNTKYMISGIIRSINGSV